jgi:hypothetical protein
MRVRPHLCRLYSSAGIQSVLGCCMRPSCQSGIMLPHIRCYKCSARVVTKSGGQSRLGRRAMCLVHTTPTSGSPSVLHCRCTHDMRSTLKFYHSLTEERTLRSVFGIARDLAGARFSPEDNQVKESEKARSQTSIATHISFGSQEHHVFPRRIPIDVQHTCLLQRTCIATRPRGSESYVPSLHCCVFRELCRRYEM